MTVKNHIKAADLMTGDLLFMIHPSCNLSQAIDLVTQTGNDTHYSHMGIVELTSEGIVVYHSTPKSGVCCERIEQFLHPDEIEAKVTVYRLKDEFLHFIPQAISSVQRLLGEHYNHSFHLNSQGYYCSELIYRIFAPARIFDLAPMTFKDQENNEFTQHWLEYYNQLGVPIPERQPGCNPNGMSASDKLKLLGELKF